jgi:hypothetical protein
MRCSKPAIASRLQASAIVDRVAEPGSSGVSPLMRRTAVRRLVGLYVVRALTSRMPIAFLSPSFRFAEAVTSCPSKSALTISARPRSKD